MMSRSVMDLKDVCLELCAGGILMKALKLVNLPNCRSLDPGVGRTLKVPKRNGKLPTDEQAREVTPEQAEISRLRAELARSRQDKGGGAKLWQNSL